MSLLVRLTFLWKMHSFLESHANREFYLKWLHETYATEKREHFENTLITLSKILTSKGIL